MDLYNTFKYFAFRIDAERMHDFTLGSLSHLPQLAKLFDPVKVAPNLSLKSGGLQWRFPVGLAAGFDKNAQCIEFFEKMGFGAIEIGTITKEPQSGNPKPRIFRLKEIESVRNAMGFPNIGSHAILDNLKNSHFNDICIGSNIGKNKKTLEEQTPQEHAYLYSMFAPFSDYLVINISSPNTPGLRSFQKTDLLRPILEAVNEKRKLTPRPLYLKISPDIDDETLTNLCELAKEMKLSGIIATNTTTQHTFGPGGASGKYIKDISKSLRKKVCERLNEDPNLSVIGVGGIDSFADIKEFWQQGGGFTQVYTSYIYKGPRLLKDIQIEILNEIKKHQCSDLQEYFSHINQF